MKYSLIALSVGVLGCSGTVDTPTRPVDQTPVTCVLSVIVSPAALIIVPGDTVRLTYNGGGCGKPTTAANWSSANTSIATVDPASGLVTGFGLGITTITAADKADPTVKGAALISVVAPLPVSPLSVTLFPGDQIQFSAKVDSVNLPVAWSSSDTTLITVSATGLAKAKALGSATIRATSSKNIHYHGSATMLVVANSGGSDPVIRSINYASTGGPAKLDSLAGPIDLTATIGLTTTADLIINDGVRDTTVATAASQNVLDDPAITLRWNTDAKTAASSRVFANGAYTMRVNFHQPNSTTVISSTTQAVTVKNP